MRRNVWFAVCVLSAVLVPLSGVSAERGGGGRGGAPHPAPHNEPRGGGGGFNSRPGGPGGAPHSGGGHSSGGIGGGLTPSSNSGRRPEGMNSFGGGAHGAPAAGPTTRPGVGGANGPRPGVGAGGVGGPASGVGVRPGVGAGAPGIGGPASGVGVRPGVGAGAPGVGAPGVGRPGMPVAADAAYGTRYRNEAVMADQAAAVRTAEYRRYDAAMYATYANAWRPVNLTTASVYAHPGYSSLAVGLKMDSQATAYDYGGNVVVQPNGVYVDGVQTATTQEYSQQASQIAAAGQSADVQESAKWLPLGVFALVDGDATSSDDVFELAVNHDGVLRGNYHQLSTDAMEPLTGSVDRKTQRAAWKIGKDQTPVYDAGVANLTKDTTSILIHLGDGKTRQMTLVRLQQPAQ